MGGGPRPPRTAMPRVLIADDSPTTRDLLRELIDSAPDLEVVATAENGLEAVERVRATLPDVIVMDIAMPLMNGIEATRRVMTEVPTPILVVSNAIDVQSVRVSLEALRAGAMSLAQKPGGPAWDDFEAETARFLETLRSISRVPMVRRVTDRRPALAVPGGDDRACRVVGISTSIGGPAALCNVLSRLPDSFDAPIVIVQHQLPGFTQQVAEWLGGESPLQVAVAEDGEALAPGKVYFPPEGRGLRVEDGGILSLDADRGADQILKDLADSYGPGAVGLVMTGSGFSGLEGMRAIRERGGRVLAQDLHSAADPSLPKAAIDAGLPTEVLPLAEIPTRLMQLALGQRGAAAVEVEAQAEAPPRPRVLVVEDSLTQAEALSDLLTSWHMEPTVCSTSAAAWDRLHAEPFELVLTDAIMPGSTGYDLCRAIRASDDHRDLPVVLLTAQSNPGDLVRALAVGASAFVPKPFDGPRLVSRLRKLIEVPRPSAEAEAAEEVVVGGEAFRIRTSRAELVDYFTAALEDYSRAQAMLEEDRLIAASARDAHEPLHQVLAALGCPAAVLDDLGRVEVSNAGWRASVAIASGASYPDRLERQDPALGQRVREALDRLRQGSRQEDLGVLDGVEGGPRRRVALGRLDVGAALRFLVSHERVEPRSPTDDGGDEVAAEPRPNRPEGG